MVQGLEIMEWSPCSSVVRTFTNKIGRPLRAVLLAENDEEVRQLVCAEFGYR